MVHWTGIVLGFPGPGSDAMASRLPAHLHPIAGRPLVWHSVWALTELTPRPERLLVLTDSDLPPELFQDLPVGVEVVALSADELARREIGLGHGGEEFVLVVDAAALVTPSSLQELREGGPGRWLAGGAAESAAAWLDATHLSELFRLPQPLAVPNGVLGAQDRLRAADAAILVRDRVQLGEASRRVRDRLVRGLMLGGATFLLPETVLVDVDVRIGRDSVVYPGVVLEGQTTIGDETVVGPGCRIIDSWVGSGVELKGWNYISHTSIRNRAILEPYVRRGFD